MDVKNEVFLGIGVSKAFLVGGCHPAGVPRQFAKATGILAKTDRLDAAALANFASMIRPAVREAPDQETRELAELGHAADSCGNACAQGKARLVTAKGARQRVSLKEQIDWLDERIGTLDVGLTAALRTSSS